MGEPLRHNVLKRCNEAVEKKITSLINQGQEDAFCVIDLEQIRLQRQRWSENLPRVQPFYAVKCNPDPVILEEFVKLNDVNFDCASRAEIDAVMTLGVSADRIIYANPCKPISHVRHAAAVGVTKTTFDNSDELVKIAKYHPEAEVILRLLPDDSSAICQLGQKFGADIEDVPDLLKLAKFLNLNFIGFSFHVGSGCRDANAYVDAVRLARKAFDVAISVGLKPRLLDIGGGFPGEQADQTPMGNISFEQIAELMRPVLDELFRDDIEIISEPGRYFVHSSTTLVANIIARRSLGNALTFPEMVEEAREELEGKEHNEDEHEHENGNGNGNGNDNNSRNRNGNSNNYRNNDDSLSKPSSSISSFTSTKFTKTRPFGYMYYINDGMYGSFNCLLYDHATVFPHVYTQDASEMEERITSRGLMRCSIWGPTCDGLDRICQSIDLPELEVGEWLYFPSMGAYTTAASSKFNGFERPSNFYIRGSISYNYDSFV